MHGYVPKAYTFCPATFVSYFPAEGVDLFIYVHNIGVDMRATLDDSVCSSSLTTLLFLALLLNWFHISPKLLNRRQKFTYCLAQLIRRGSNLLSVVVPSHIYVITKCKCFCYRAFNYYLSATPGCLNLTGQDYSAHVIRTPHDTLVSHREVSRSPQPIGRPRIGMHHIMHG